MKSNGNRFHAKTGNQENKSNMMRLANASVGPTPCRPLHYGSFLAGLTELRVEIVHATHPEEQPHAIISRETPPRRRIIEGASGRATCLPSNEMPQQYLAGSVNVRALITFHALSHIPAAFKEPGAKVRDLSSASDRPFPSFPNK